MIDGDLIALDLNAAAYDISQRLGELSSKTPSVLVNALNATARKVRKQIVKNARGDYAIKGGSKLLTYGNDTMTLTRAKKGSYYAKLRAAGGMNELMAFQVTPGETAVAGNGPACYAARVLSQSAMKSLGHDPKPFVVQFASGHRAIVAREGDERLPIKKLLSPSVPSMLANPEIQASASSMVEDILPQEIENQIHRILAKAAEK